MADKLVFVDFSKLFPDFQTASARVGDDSIVEVKLVSEKSDCDDQFVRMDIDHFYSLLIQCRGEIKRNKDA